MNQNNKITNEEVTEKSRKTDILNAYRELLAKVREKKQTHPKVESKKKENKDIIDKAASLSGEKIITSVADLKLELGKNLDVLEERMLVEHKKFSSLQTAVQIENQHLEAIYGIKSNADSLSALLLAQKEKKEHFENEIEAMQNNWELEQETYEKEQAEKQKEESKARKREEEEYQYKLKLKRERETDAYEQKKKALEQELIFKKADFEKSIAEREKSLTESEQELNDLRQQVDEFPDKLAKSVEEAKIEVQNQLEMGYNHKIQLTESQNSGERKLLDQTINSLRAKIKEQEAMIDQITSKNNAVGNQVQQIAIKAIEGASVRNTWIPPQSNPYSKTSETQSPNNSTK